MKRRASGSPTTVEKRQRLYSAFNEYEMSRFVSTFVALRDNGLNDPVVLCRVMDLFVLIHRFCATCQHTHDPLQRRYYLADSPDVYRALCDRYEQSVIEQVDREARLLLERGSSAENLIVVCANDNPRDRLGTFVRYEGDDEFRALLRSHIRDWIDVPPIVYFVCLDACSLASVRQHLDWSSERLAERYASLGLCRGGMQTRELHGQIVLKRALWLLIHVLKSISRNSLTQLDGRGDRRQED